MYSAPCRWYRTGGLGRIRYYEVPSTNRQFFGEDVFWPVTESEAKVRPNTGLPGECGKRTYDRGTNFRPDLVGAHIDGTPSDFAGLTPLPAVVIPPECASPPGIRLPILIRDHGRRFFGNFSGLSVRVKFEDQGDLWECLTYWLKPEQLDIYGNNQNIPEWPSFWPPNEPSIPFSTLPPKRQTDDNTGLPVAQSIGLTQWQIPANIPFGLAVSWYLVFQYAEGAQFPWPTMFGPGLGGGKTYANILGQVIYWDTHNAIFAPGQPLDHPGGIFWVRKPMLGRIAMGRNTLPFYEGGMNPTGFLKITAFSGLLLQELLIFNCFVDDKQHEEILGYLVSKFKLPVGGDPYFSQSYFAKNYFSERYY